MKYLWNIFFDGVLAFMLIAGIGLNIDGATATAHGFIWLCAILSVFSLTHQAGRKIIAKAYIHCSLLWRFYDLISDIAFFAIAVWLNWYVLAVLLLLRVALKQEFYCKRESALREEA
ncbi:hypothetical protein FA839_22735 [Salmonella enterica subsp. enterica serovar Nchanga]|nr:hypothetical protein [Salmonella enterica subsp. enterica serovar Nchanga]